MMNGKYLKNLNSPIELSMRPVFTVKIDHTYHKQCNINEKNNQNCFQFVSLIKNFLNSLNV